MKRVTSMSSNQPIIVGASSGRGGRSFTILALNDRPEHGG